MRIQTGSRKCGQQRERSMKPALLPIKTISGSCKFMEKPTAAGRGWTAPNGREHIKELNYSDTKPHLGGLVLCRGIWAGAGSCLGPARDVFCRQHDGYPGLDRSLA